MQATTGFASYLRQLSTKRIQEQSQRGIRVSDDDDEEPIGCVFHGQINELPLSRRELAEKAQFLVQSIFYLCFQVLIEGRDIAFHNTLPITRAADLEFEERYANVFGADRLYEYVIGL